MRNTGAEKTELLDHLESAFTIAEGLHQPVLAYLIERAIDEAKAADIRSLDGD